MKDNFNCLVSVGMGRLTLDLFLSRARKAHGDKYEYEHVVLVNGKTKIRIGCPVHGIFEQIPDTHMRGFGCKACGAIDSADKRRFTAHEFIKRSRSAHGSRYDYSRVIYRGNDQNVAIICSEHGTFSQTPAGHMSGKGCSRCAAAKRGSDRRSSIATFIEKAKAVHRGKYDYSSTVYRTSNDDVEIICPTHGLFSQNPNNHLRGKGCRKCGEIVLSSLFRKESDVYLAEIQAAHGSRLDYSLANYKSAYSPVTLICSTHGPITKPARDWLKHGCFQCGVNTRAQNRRFSTQKFIQLARERHGDKYSYELSRYTGIAEKLTISCRLHGTFRQTAATHLKGSGCRQCAIDEALFTPRLTQQEFIDRCIAVHDGFYDYSTTAYQRTHDQIEIICPLHGSFSQLASNHVRGHGCRRCAGYGRTTEEFIDDARAVHGDRYDYSNTEFETVDGIVSIICKIHGSFQQRALGHLHGKGCTGCQHDGWRLSQDEFLERSRAMHGDEYDYSQVVYGRTNRHKVKIICLDHGPFEQMPVAHLEGHGCRHCYYDGRRMTLEEFLESARAVHGNKYDYAEVAYHGMSESIDIKCIVHGVFRQAAYTHVRGSGCPDCNLFGQYSLKAAIRGDYDSAASAGERTLYVARQLRSGEPTFVKVGLAKQGYKRRYSASHPYATEGSPDRLTLPTELAVIMEQCILRATTRFHYDPDLEFPGGARECRTLEALPIIEDMIADFSSNPARLAATPWVEQEARRHGLLHLVEDFRRRIGQLAS
ncbi:hypothetical protein RAD15_25435 [Bradyrhizobium sp. 14AA]